MKKLNLNDSIKYVIKFIIIIGIVIICTIFITSLIMKKKNQNTDLKEIVCVKENAETKETDYYRVMYDETGELIKYFKEYETYFEKDVYDASKKIYTDGDDYVVRFNDKKQTMTTIYTFDNFQDNEGKSIHTWYKDFINSLLDQGYTCDE